MMEDGTSTPPRTARPVICPAFSLAYDVDGLG
jgi:hypothetical protein